MELQLEVPGVPDFDDEPTVIQVREVPDEPPPLPFALRRARHREDDSWIHELPESAREVLMAARYPVESWPRAPRVAGAIAMPAKPIPSLSRRV